MSENVTLITYRSYQAELEKQATLLAAATTFGATNVIMTSIELLRNRAKNGYMALKKQVLIDLLTSLDQPDLGEPAEKTKEEITDDVLYIQFTPLTREATSKLAELYQAEQRQTKEVASDVQVTPVDQQSEEVQEVEEEQQFTPPASTLEPEEEGGTADEVKVVPVLHIVPTHVEETDEVEPSDGEKGDPRFAELGEDMVALGYEIVKGPAGYSVYRNGAPVQALPIGKRSDRAIKHARRHAFHAGEITNIRPVLTGKVVRETTPKAAKPTKEQREEAYLAFMRLLSDLEDRALATHLSDLANVFKA